MPYEGTIVSTFGTIVLRRCEIHMARLGLGKGDFTLLFQRSIESAHAAQLLFFFMFHFVIFIQVKSSYIYVFQPDLFKRLK